MSLQTETRARMPVPRWAPDVLADICRPPVGALSGLLGKPWPAKLEFRERTRPKTDFEAHAVLAARVP